MTTSRRQILKHIDALRAMVADLPDTERPRRRPVINDLHITATADSLQLEFDTDVPTDFQVFDGVVSKFSAAGIGTQHTGSVDGLQPDTAYAWRLVVDADEGGSEVPLEFHTEPEPAA